MRIISGIYRGRVIKMPKGIRPTQEKVRKAIFDILADLEGLSVLELYAGSGAVGIEALSYGAKEVVFVEKDPLCSRVLKENLGLLGASGWSLLAQDSLKALEKLVKEKRRFGIIFLDPPYYRELAKKTLQILGAYDILAPDGLVVVQHFKKDILPKQEGELTCFKQASYGDTLLTFYRKV